MTCNCPVCNKTGLPDYRSVEVVCPQCNSNLRPYLVLSKFSNNGGNKKNKFILPIAIISFATIVLVIYFNERNIKETSVTNKSETTIVNNKVDSTSYYKDKLKQLEAIPKTLDTPTEVAINYAVKRGDCLSTIAQNFYGDWRTYTKIEEDNKLQKPYRLNPGQILIIKIKVQ
jgi:LysM repeat protein